MTRPVVNQECIAVGLRELGLTAGDIVLLHSSLASLGQVEGGADAVVDAFLQVLGPAGTLVVPTFGDLGVIPEVVAARPGAVASVHPKASVAALGPAAAAICRDHWKAATAHGLGTPYTRIAERGGSVCLLGVDQDRNTTLHTVEALLRLPYLRTTEEVTFATPADEVTRSWDFFPGPHRDFIGLDRRLRERGIVRLARIGGAVVRLMRSRDLIDDLMELGRRDPAFALCRNPCCADCAAQRAAISKRAWDGEAFQVVTAASLAGDTPDGIGAACAAAGVRLVELDRLEGTEVDAMTPPAAQAAVRSLAQQGCRVTALRWRRSPAAGPAVDTALACGVRRLVVPLDESTGALAAAATCRGCQVLACNTGQTGARVFEALSGWCDAGLRVELAFCPAAFIRAGEKPFLDSFRQRLGRFVGQLDVEDAASGDTASETSTSRGSASRGGATCLARGHGEIKELVSILRCRSFAGPLVLSAANRRVGDLRLAAADFEALLRAL